MSKRYSRVEVIGSKGRELVYYGQAEAHEQDGGKTLKIFKKGKEKFDPKAWYCTACGVRSDKHGTDCKFPNKPFLTQKEMDAVEDQFFCVNSKKQYEQMRPALLRVWKKLCRIHDKKEKNTTTEKKINEPIPKSKNMAAR